MKTNALLNIALLLILASAWTVFLWPVKKRDVVNSHLPESAAAVKTQLSQTIRLRQRALQLQSFARQNHYNSSVAFLIDMSRPSGKKRFFIYDLKRKRIINSGLVAHGSCNTRFLTDKKFDNTPGCGCTSEGKYAIGGRYKGRFGTAFKLRGLDKSNSNAYARAIVLHSYYCVPDEETYPSPICNSLGCPMVSDKFFKVLQKEISTSQNPLLLWIYE